MTTPPEQPQTMTATDPRVLALSELGSLIGYLEAYSSPLPGSVPLTREHMQPLLDKARRVRRHVEVEFASRTVRGPIGKHTFQGARADRPCEICQRPDRDVIHEYSLE